MSCSSCFSGTESQHIPTGYETTLHSYKTYVASPPNGSPPKGIIVLIPDAFGWQFPNNRVLADHYAEKGNFIVYLPEFMNGNSGNAAAILLMSEVTKPQPWITTLFYKPFYIMRIVYAFMSFLWWNRDSVCGPRIYEFMTRLRQEEEGGIGIAGFCWGGGWVFTLCAERDENRTVCSSALKPRHLIDVAFTAHPSRLSIPDDASAVRIPISVAVGDNDVALGAAKVTQMKSILEQDPDNEVVIMPGAIHGFAVRTEPEKLQMEYADRAEDQAVQWFTKWLC